MRLWKAATRKRTLAAAAGCAIIVVGTLLTVARRTPSNVDTFAAPQPVAAVAPDGDADSVPLGAEYVASDVSLLATTGRPQLLEFFHHR